MVASDFFYWSSHYQENTPLHLAMVQMAAKDNILKCHLCAAFLLAAQDMVKIHFLLMAKQQNLATMITHNENRCILRPISRQQGKCHINAWIDIRKSHETKRYFLARLLIYYMMSVMQLQDGLLSCCNIQLP